MRTETLDEFRYLKIWLVQTTSRCVRISVEATCYTPQVIGYGSSWISMLFITPKVFNIKARGRAAQPRVTCHHQIADPNGVQQNARQ